MSKPSSSYDAFSKVDELVAKPVLGSDGAASWQDFQKSNKLGQKASVAPKAPLKAADRAAGFTSWNQERENEVKLRQQAGHQQVGTGYTTFKVKSDEKNGTLTKKQRKRIEQRLRPEDQPYYTESKKFQGWKKDYIFTTRDRGTGYYWDGNDSLKEMRGKAVPDVLPAVIRSAESTSDEDKKTEKALAQPKQKKRREEGPTIVINPNDPREQIERILAKHRGGDGWEQAIDPSSGKVYYWNRATGERSWTNPELPTGWQSAQAADGKTYYYHAETGETRWDRPNS